MKRQNLSSQHQHYSYSSWHSPFNTSETWNYNNCFGPATGMMGNDLHPHPRRNARDVLLRIEQIWLEQFQNKGVHGKQFTQPNRFQPPQRIKPLNSEVPDQIKPGSGDGVYWNWKEGVPRRIISIQDIIRIIWGNWLLSRHFKSSIELARELHSTFPQAKLKDLDLTIQKMARELANLSLEEQNGLAGLLDFIQQVPRYSGPIAPRPLVTAQAISAAAQPTYRTPSFVDAFVPLNPSSFIENEEGELSTKRRRICVQPDDDDDSGDFIEFERNTSQPLDLTPRKRSESSPSESVCGRDSALGSSNASLLSPSERSATSPERKVHAKSEPPKALTKAERLEIRQLAVNRQQKRLFRDPRVIRLNDRFRNAETVIPGSFYASMSKMGTYVLENGQAAQTHSDPREADFLVFNNREYSDWLEKGTGDKVVLFRDRPILNNRPDASSEGMLEKLLRFGPETMIDVQDLSENLSSSRAVKRMPIAQVIERMRSTDESVAPVNCLDIACKAANIIPPALAQLCEELNDAATYADIQANRRHKDRQAAIGKKKVETKHTLAVDIDQCMTFQINGQAGAFSSWHMDHCGVSTVVTLEHTSKNRTKQTLEMKDADNEKAAKYDNYYWNPEDEEVLKLWAIVRTDNSSAEKREEVLEAFKIHGVTWYPPPELIKVIALVRGDTLVMPPGTIHAPITVTNCLFRGGMVMQKRNLFRTIKFWRYLSDNPDCTNEDKPKETRAVIDYINLIVHHDPEACGFSDAESLRQFDEDCKVISGASLSCDCVKVQCGPATCGCQRYGQRCGSACHASRKHVMECCNPLGHEPSEKTVEHNKPDDKCVEHKLGEKAVVDHNPPQENSLVDVKPSLQGEIGVLEPEKVLIGV